MYKFSSSKRASAHQAAGRGKPHQPEYRNGSKGVDVKVRGAHLASALRVKNLRSLRDRMGEDNLAIALEMSLPRMKELYEGIDFTNETAHHIETTLSLPSGYLDLVNPTLTQELINKLKYASEVSAPQEPKVHHPSTSTMADSTGTAQSQPQAQALHSALSSHVEPTQEQTMTQPQTASPSLTPAAAPARVGRRPAAPASPDELRLREVRKNNLALLTSAKGAKSKLGLLVDMTPVNISHRLHGNKHFDEATAQFFCEKLHLEQGWFDEPRTAQDIPKELLEKLGAPALAAAAPAQKTAPAESSAKAPAARKPRAPRATESVIPAVMTPPLETPAVAAPTQALATRPAAAPVATAVESPVLEALGAAPSGAIGPIAEALIKTLGFKSRQGTFTESQALRWLTELVSA